VEISLVLGFRADSPKVYPISPLFTRRAHFVETQLAASPVCAVRAASGTATVNPLEFGANGNVISGYTEHGRLEFAFSCRNGSERCLSLNGWSRLWVLISLAPAAQRVPHPTRASCEKGGMQNVHTTDRTISCQQHRPPALPRFLCSRCSLFSRPELGFSRPKLGETSDCGWIQRTLTSGSA
jgi:hypothetical protein